jgi:hypothetical protein
MTVYLSSLAGAGAQFLDNNGDILSGGKIYTYAAGTTNPAVTYTSASGVSQNSFPIILDSAGRPAEEIWLDESQTYRFDVADANDVLIRSYDNIPGINDFATGDIPWANITGTPTTLAGYGITDGITAATAAATYAPIASPTFTGTPLIPDNDTTSANYPVGYREAPRNAQTGNYTLVLADRGKSVVMGDGTATALTLTIPASTTVSFPVGTVIIIVNRNTVGLSVAITTDTLTLANSVTSGTRTVAQNGIGTCVKIENTVWLMGGAGVS